MHCKACDKQLSVGESRWFPHTLRHEDMCHRCLELAGLRSWNALGNPAFDYEAELDKEGLLMQDDSLVTSNLNELLPAGTQLDLFTPDTTE